jgi:ech hydrogenase subunit D
MTNTTDVTLDQLHGEVSALQRHGYRLVTMTCIDVGEGHEVLYHFDKQYELRNLRLKLGPGVVLPSISNIFFSATLVENEMKDLFGLEIDGLAIDYKGRFILSDGAPSAPLSKKCGMAVDVRVKGAAAAEGGAAS